MILFEGHLASSEGRAGACSGSGFENPSSQMLAVIKKMGS